MLLPELGSHACLCHILVSPLVIVHGPLRDFLFRTIRLFRLPRLPRLHRPLKPPVLGRRSFISAWLPRVPVVDIIYGVFLNCGDWPEIVLMTRVSFLSEPMDCGSEIDLSRCKRYYVAKDCVKSQNT